MPNEDGRILLKNNKVLIDPPEGWRYGFPKIYDMVNDGTVEEFLIKNKYPVTPFALQYCRWIELPDDSYLRYRN